MHRFGEHDWGMGYGMGWWWIIGVAVMIVIIWFVIKAVNQNNSSQIHPSRLPLDILKERYAKGEIDKTEFEERKNDQAANLQLQNLLNPT